MKLENLSNFGITPFSLFHLLSIESYSGECTEMQIYIDDYIDFLRKTQPECSFNVHFDEFGNIFVTKTTIDFDELVGDLISRKYPCVVSHIDTVHEIYGAGIVPVQIGDKVTGINPETMEQTGIGGDDKCGIYAALKCLEYLPNCKAAFFVDEETGCDGSIKADVSFFNNCRFILQADRRGNSDFVNDINGPISSKKFQADILPIIQKYGYSFCSGMMTDVEALSDNGVGISCANISAGYYNPHMDCEYISLNDLDQVVNLILDICISLEDSYPFEFSERMDYKERLRVERLKSQKSKSAKVIPFSQQCELQYPKYGPQYGYEDEEAAYWSSFNNEITGKHSEIIGNKKKENVKDFDRELERELEEFYQRSASDLDFFPGCNK